MSELLARSEGVGIQASQRPQVVAAHYQRGPVSEQRGRVGIVGPSPRTVDRQRAISVVPRCRSSIPAVDKARLRSTSEAPCNRSSAMAFLVLAGPR
jgi:hypothetical protein